MYDIRIYYYISISTQKLKKTTKYLIRYDRELSRLSNSAIATKMSDRTKSRWHCNDTEVLCYKFTGCSQVIQERIYEYNALSADVNKTITRAWNKLRLSSTQRSVKSRTQQVRPRSNSLGSEHLICIQEVLGSAACHNIHHSAYTIFGMIK
jgi:hypothetical protein